LADPAVELLVPDRLCAKRSCTMAFCRPCLVQYYTMAAEASKYAVPFIRCPGCRGYVRAGSWRGFIAQELRQAMDANAEHLLTLRCIECDEPGTLLMSATSADMRERLEADVTEGLSDENRAALLEWWTQFSFGDDEAMTGLKLLAEQLLEGDDTQPEGSPSPVLLQRVQALLRLVEDSSRRAVLQLAFLRKWPKTKTECCDSPHCFKCKVGTHHNGVTCEEVQRRQMLDDAIQFCPGCNVATLKTEGCNSMICICGEEWTWDGDERWVDDWLGQEEEEEEPTPQAAPAPGAGADAALAPPGIVGDALSRASTAVDEVAAADAAEAAAAVAARVASAGEQLDAASVSSGPTASPTAAASAAVNSSPTASGRAAA